MKAMWAVSTVSARPFFHLTHKRPANTKPLFPFTVSANSQPPRHRSFPIPKQQPPPPKQEQKNYKLETQKQQHDAGGGEGRKQLTGLDVLWAIRRAADEKTKVGGGDGGAKKNNNKKRRGLSSVANQREEDVVDYSNVRPLSIKNEWSVRLDELEKRLQDLSQTK